MYLCDVVLDCTGLSVSVYVQVEWEAEKPCFETFARETADFYAVKTKWLSLTSDDDQVLTELDITSLDQSLSV